MRLEYHAPDGTVHRYEDPYLKINMLHLGPSLTLYGTDITRWEAAIGDGFRFPLGFRNQREENDPPLKDLPDDRATELLCTTGKLVRRIQGPNDENLYEFVPAQGKTRHTLMPAELLTAAVKGVKIFPSEDRVEG